MKTIGIEAYSSSLTPKKVASLCQKIRLGDDVGACAPGLNHNINSTQSIWLGYYKPCYFFLSLFLAIGFTALPNKHIATFSKWLQETIKLRVIV